MLKLEMKSCSIEALYEQLELQAQLKKDIVVPSKDLYMEKGSMFVKNFKQYGGLLDNTGVQAGDLAVGPNGVFLDQLSDKLGITKSYQKRLMEHLPHLYDINANQWLDYEASQKKPRSFLLRTFDNPEGGMSIGRAFLSNRFKIIDNFDILKIALNSIKQASEKSGVKIEVDTCSLTEKKMYCRFVLSEYNTNPKILGKYKDPVTGNQDPDGMCSGFILSNSEVGHGKLFIAPRIIVKHCNNGYIWYDEKFHQTHLGGKLDSGLIDWSKDTRQNNSALIISQIKDVINKFLSPDFLGQKIEELQSKGSYVLENPYETIVSICKNIGVSDSKSVLNFFTKQGQSETAFDVMQAVTYYAQHDCGPDERFKLECSAVSSMGSIQRIDKSLN